MQPNPSNEPVNASVPVSNRSVETVAGRVYPWLKQQPLAMALGLVGVWGLLAAVYLGAEDGSSGLSLFGLLQVLFFYPGLLLMNAWKGSHSNADLPWMQCVGAATFALAVVPVFGLKRSLNARTKQ